MSGVEVIGIILALIPLVWKGIERYKGGGEGTTSRQLHRNFKIQENIFMNAMEELISPLVSDLQFQILMKDPKGRSWQDHQLSASLEEHLGRSYQVFTDIMDDIQGVMMDLQEVLHVEVSPSLRLRDLGVMLKHQVKDIKSRRVHKRIRLFLSPSRSEAGLKRMSARIADLEKITGQSQRLAPSRRTRGIKIEDSLNKVRECALSLHDALSRGWQCQCATPHLANLRLEAREYARKTKPSREGEDSIRFKFLFSFATDPEEGGPLDWREAELAPLDDSARALSKPVSVAASRSNERKPSPSPQRPAGTDDSRLATPGASRPPIAPPTSDRPPGRAIRFDFPKSPALPIIRTSEPAGTVDGQEITDLCQWIKNVKTDRPNGDCLGYLSDANKLRYGLYSVNPRGNIETPLASFHISGPLSPLGARRPGRTSKREGFLPCTKTQLAFTLASTVLQLHSTPWLDKWNKQDISYYPEPGSDTGQSPVQPYISRRFSSSMSKSPGGTLTPTTRAPQGFAPNETLFTLGVVLIEIAYNQPIEDLAEKRDMGQEAGVTQYLTAMRLKSQVRAEMGTTYQRAVEGCLMCHFGFPESDVDLKSQRVQRGFVEHVVAPLEESMSHFFPESAHV